MSESDGKWRRRFAEGLLEANRLASSLGWSSQTAAASAIVFAPHPDDEVLGCGGVIALKAQAGVRVKVVVMTDGRASHWRLVGEEALVKMRRAEAEEAAAQLGLIPSNYVFLDFEDHHLSQYRDAACDRVVEVMEKFKPDEVFIPHRRDGLADHVETNRIVHDAIKRLNGSVTLFEYPVWLWNCWPWTKGSEYGADRKIMRRVLKIALDVVSVAFLCNTRVDIGKVLDRKRAALSAYRSQVERFNGDPGWPILADVAGGEFLQRFDVDFEIFRRTDHRP